jgi:GTP-binding protein HflX
MVETPSRADQAPVCAVLVQTEGLPRREREMAARVDGRSSQDRLEEALSLCAALELRVANSQMVRITKPRAASLLGGGHIETLKDIIQAEAAELLVVNASLTPLQQRNLEKALGVKVMDRVGLIIEIFGARAQTNEGQLQVELAAQTYQRSRLVRAWSGLDRQRGGRGLRGGPGEMQIELDRRRIDERILRLKKELAKVRQTRALHRKARQRAPYPIVVLVGYTNAGKSTLFNALTAGGVMAKDMLFATLDPTHRRLQLPGGGLCLLVDSVGFIADLPTELIEAFKATLEEVESADLILHLRDLSHPNTAAQRSDVLKILTDLIGEQACQERVLEVGNKIDRLTPEEQAAMQNSALLSISAAQGQGLQALLALIAQRLGQDDQQFEIQMPMGDSALRGQVYQIARQLEERVSEPSEAEGQSSLVLRGHLNAKAKGQLERLLENRHDIRLSYL